MENIIKKDSFAADSWRINSANNKFKGDPLLFEKTLHAFSLLSYLAQIDLNFVFKGGSSLLLHSKKIRRLSIDIDIIYKSNDEKLHNKLKTIPGNFPFVRMGEDERGDRSLPNRKHFKFFYNSEISGKEDYVLLDIVFEDPNYLPFVEKKVIKIPFFEVEREISVSVPTVEGLLGDKLTAFAPNTIGIPFYNSKGYDMTMQVAKQMFDIGQLFTIAGNYGNIVTAFNEVSQREISYHQRNFSRKQVLMDMIEVAIGFLTLRLKGAEPSDDSKYLQDGVKKLSSHLVSCKFRIDIEAKIAAAKIFLLANNIMHKSKINLNRIKYNDGLISEIKDTSLPVPYQKLNRLKPILPEAFYYIWKGI